MILARDGGLGGKIWLIVSKGLGELLDEVGRRATISTEVGAYSCPYVIYAEKEEPVLFLLNTAEDLFREDVLRARKIGERRFVIDSMTEPEIRGGMVWLDKGLADMGVEVNFAHAMRRLAEILSVLSDERVRILQKSILKPFRYKVGSQFRQEVWCRLNPVVMEKAVGPKISSIVQEYLEKVDDRARRGRRRQSE